VLLCIVFDVCNAFVYLVNHIDSPFEKNKIANTIDHITFYCKINEIKRKDLTKHLEY